MVERLQGRLLLCRKTGYVSQVVYYGHIENEHYTDGGKYEWKYIILSAPSFNTANAVVYTPEIKPNKKNKLDNQGFIQEFKKLNEHTRFFYGKVEDLKIDAFQFLNHPLLEDNLQASFMYKGVYYTKNRSSATVRKWATIHKLREGYLTYNTTLIQEKFIDGMYDEEIINSPYKVFKE